MPSQTKPADPRTRVLDSATRLLAKKGATFGMDELARAAGLSRATLYRVVPSREALFSALAERGVSVPRAEVSTRARILEAARAELCERGLAVTVEEIAARAEVSAVTVYRHFADRRSLVAAVAEESAHRRKARQLASSAGGSLEEGLAAYAAEALAWMRDNLGLLRVALAAAATSPAEVALLRDAPSGSTRALTALFRARIRAGEIRGGDPRRLALAFNGMVIATGFLGPAFEGAPPPDAERTGAFLARLFVRGLSSCQETDR